VQADRAAQAKALLLDYHWLTLKLATYSVQAVIADTQLMVDSELQQLGQTLRLSAHVLASNPSQLAPQLIGRLSDPAGNGTRRLLAHAIIRLPTNVLVPRGGKHLAESGALISTLAGHKGWIEGALLLPVGRRALSWSSDSTLRLWDLDSGTARSFEGHD